MLERFSVPAADQVRVDHEALRRTIADLFVACGVGEAEARAGADVLVMADLRGVETHGCSNMLRQYIGWFRTGVHNPQPNWTVLHETPGTATIDGDRGLGILQGGPAMQLAIDKARDVGVGVVTMRNSGHLGPIGHFSYQAAEHDMIGICMTASSLLIVPTFGALPRYGTNPIAFAAPARSHPFMLFDAAMSSVASNKIGLARRVGANMEPGWIAEPDGTPIMDERPAPSGEFSLLPLGGTREQGSHKGYGLGLFVEVMTTLLAGAVPRMIERDTKPRHCFIAYNIAAFTDLDWFKETMDQMLQTLVDTPTAPGHDRVLYPGLPEHETEQQRRANGIPLHREVIDWFNGITDELGVDRLETM
jgi:LDH2 family malate/lactate/ureidoglycolate dehydrogenase